MAFDERINCVNEKKRSKEAEPYILHAKKTMELSGKLMYSFLWQYYPTKDWKLFEKSYDYLNELNFY
jgi:hypothetical protein